MIKQIKNNFYYFSIHSSSLIINIICFMCVKLFTSKLVNSESKVFISYSKMKKKLEVI